MNNKAFVSYGIRPKLIAVFGALFSLSLAAVILVSFYGVPFLKIPGIYGIMRKEILRGFETVADIQRARFLSWLEERKGDMKVLAGVLQLTPELRENLELRKRIYGAYKELMVTDEDGAVIVSTGAIAPGEKPFGTLLSSSFLQDDFQVAVVRDPFNRQDHSLLLAYPVKERRLLICLIGFEEVIWPMFRTGRALGDSDEVVLVDSDSRLLMPFKFPLPDGSTAVPFEWVNTAEPARSAARGEDGIMNAKDYRGKDVLAAHRSIILTPEVRWGLVVKRDASEAYAVLRRALFYLTLLLLLSVGLGLLVISSLSARILRPVSQMASAAGRIREGDFSARVDASSRDEIGVLATAFNLMASRLQGWKKEIEEEVRKRTAEINAANQQLRASEQQLLAANQQLRASQQQLKAMNQQLIANEQRLRAEIVQREKMEQATQKHLNELHIFYKASIGREERILELKKEIRLLTEKLMKYDKGGS